MEKVAIIIYAGMETPADQGRLYHALETAERFDESLTDEARLIFEGAGTQWVPELEQPSHDFHESYAAVEDIVVCEACADSHGIITQIEDEHVTIYGELTEHPSLLSLMNKGYDIITF